MVKTAKVKKVPANDLIANTFGENVFSLKVMAKCLSPKAFKSIENTIKTGGKLRVVCCPVGKLKRNGRCKVGMKVQTVLTPR